MKRRLYCYAEAGGTNGTPYPVSFPCLLSIFYTWKGGSGAMAPGEYEIESDDEQDSGTESGLSI